MKREYEARLIRNKSSALAGLLLTGFLAVMTFRAAFSHSPRNSYWLLPLDFLLPRWPLLVVNVAFYTYLLWLCVAFFRTAQGKERVLVAGWVPGILLSPVQSLVSISAAADIQYVKAASIAVALVAAVLILLEGPADDDAQPDNSVPG